MKPVDRHPGRTLSASEREWLDVRRHLVEHRYELGKAAAELYPEVLKVAGTPLLTRPGWLPTEPVPLDAVDLELRPDAPFHGLTGTEPVAEKTLPTRPDGGRYPSYSAAMAALAAPAMFENRGTYRLLDADLSGPRGRLVFGRGRYFDGIDTGEACAHEYVATGCRGPLREAIGDPCDLTRRPTGVAITTLTVRHDQATGDASFLLHWRDPAKVGHAGGLYTVIPVGIFQPSSDQPWNERNDFSLWRSVIREYSEELLGEPEDHGSDRTPIDYDAWPFAARMKTAFREGRLRAYCLGLGVDPLTLATDLLTVVVIEAPLFDELFGTPTAANGEGRLLGVDSDSRLSFTTTTIERFARTERTQAASAAVLRLAPDVNRVLNRESV